MKPNIVYEFIVVTILAIIIATASAFFEDPMVFWYLLGALFVGYLIYYFFIVLPNWWYRLGLIPVLILLWSFIM